MPVLPGESGPDHKARVERVAAIHKYLLLPKPRDAERQRAVFQRVREMRHQRAEQDKADAETRQAEAANKGTTQKAGLLPVAARQRGGCRRGTPRTRPAGQSSSSASDGGDQPPPDGDSDGGSARRRCERRRAR